MAAQAGVRKILNDVIDGDSIIDYFNIENATGMYPGAGVKKGTTDYDIVVCAADDLATGWLGYGACNGPDKPATRDTIYLVGAEAPVHSGGGFRVRCRGSTLSAAKGDELAIDTAGVVTNATIGTDHVAAKAAETVTNASNVWATSDI
jgi:hypothetical protein